MSDTNQPRMERLGAIIRTDEHTDIEVMASAVMSLIIASQILGDMTPQEIAEAAAIALVEKGGFHRRQYC
jgi:hypothetical protein